MHTAGRLPSPACGRGAGGEGRRWHADGLDFVDTPALSPTPLPPCGRGEPSPAVMACVQRRTAP
ncbi:protein of unknown function [Cupriavidus taiwanensis]|uniref:Uncharacterized protein n=1 Tax=Cupriavidus taiwanensis TaxID=164546 RepID=A0A375IDS1_9BURK|nr:hypothetical protein CBM2608_A60107 [Cupriavidus taiwanensis]SPA46979.1 hypothetical protein CBM2629_A80068 [Cupriavidus taiwanensis]SPK72924.1 protein of unknown function [Cupriavidus taiwanensis]